MAARKYNYGNIRTLLIQGFNEDELRTLCYDDPEFKTVYDNWPRGTPKSVFVQELIDLAERRLQLDRLLNAAEKLNQARYQQHQPYYEEEEKAPAIPAGMPETPPQGNDIFISYSRRDMEFVQQLYQNLTGLGIRAWFDKTNIQAGDQWRSSIVEGIRDCKVFLLVLSPDSTASNNVRKEVDLAERYKKQILPLMWREAAIPVAMEYQLAGIQWFDFKQEASSENFSQLAGALQRLLGGASLTEAVSNKPAAREATVPAAQKEEAAPAGPKKLGGLKKKQTFSPITVGGAVIASVVTTFELDTEDQDFVNKELKWLFAAADNFIKIRRGEASLNQPVAVPVPPDAEQQPGANNCLIGGLDAFNLQIWEGQVDSQFTRINTHLRNLDILLKQEAQLGEEGQRNVALQNQIKGERLSIVRILQEMTQLMNQAYGVLVTSPGQLMELLR